MSDLSVLGTMRAAPHKRYHVIEMPVVGVCGRIADATHAVIAAPNLRATDVRRKQLQLAGAVPLSAVSLFIAMLGCPIASSGTLLFGVSLAPSRSPRRHLLTMLSPVGGVFLIDRSLVTLVVNAAHVNTTRFADAPEPVPRLGRVVESAAVFNESTYHAALDARQSAGVAVSPPDVSGSSLERLFACEALETNSLRGSRCDLPGVQRCPDALRASLRRGTASTPAGKRATALSAGQGSGCSLGHVRLSSSRSTPRVC